jgi:hypothetical protein
LNADDKRKRKSGIVRRNVKIRFDVEKIDVWNEKNGGVTRNWN